MGMSCIGIISFAPNPVSAIGTSQDLVKITMRSCETTSWLTGLILKTMFFAWKFTAPYGLGIITHGIFQRLVQLAVALYEFEWYTG